MAGLPTIEVYIDGVESPVIINESDFDPNIHSKEAQASTPKEPKQPKQPKEPKQSSAPKGSNASKENKEPEQPKE